CLLVGIFYLNARVLVPRLLFQNRIGWFITSVVLSAFAIMLVIHVIEHWLNLPLLMYQAFNPDGDSPPTSTLFSFKFNIFILLIALFVLGISTSVAAVQKWQKDTQL